jgi:putative transposase
MTFDPRFRHRRSIRLRDYSYAWMGFYFVTVCGYQRQCLFGEILDGRMILNGSGLVVDEEWRMTPRMRPNVRLDAFVVMPNHFHGILQITPTITPENVKRAVEGDRRSPVQPSPNNNVTPEVVGATCGRPQRGDGLQGPESKSVGAIVGGFKSACTSRVNGLCGTPGIPLWQRNFFERVIRNEEELLAVRRYIENNPAEWAEDEENPERD